MHNLTFIKTGKLFIARAFFTFLVLFNLIPVYAQVPGCKDPAANNYNSSATVNDGSCAYNVTSYSPVTKVNPLNAILNESSGLQMAGNSLWSFNDGGGAAAIYRIDTLSNIIQQTVNLGGAANVDWEDISFDGTYFYVGDFGNNANGARTNLKIYKFGLSAIPADYNANPVVTIPSGQIEIINFIYSDQGTPVSTKTDSTRFDCEAMIIDNAQIHLFTKNWVDTITVHYVINSIAAGSYVATPVDTLATGYFVTAADKVPGQNIILLLGYQTIGFANHYMHLLSDYSGGKYFNGNKRRIDLPNALTMGQAEGLTFRNSTYGYISNEKLLSINPKLFSFNISNFEPLYVLPLTLKNFTVNDVNGSHKISWVFDDAVQNVHVEYSSNSLDFISLKSYNNSLADVFFNKAFGPVSYYRISWQKNNGAIQYSNVIIIENQARHSISNFLLKANGELSFFLNSSSAGLYSFKLLSSDGRLLSQAKEQSYTPGLNKLNLSKSAILNNFVYVMVMNDKQVTTTFLRVQK